MKKLILLFAIFSWAVFPQQLIEKFAGEAFANNYGYKLLGQICDLCGGRLMGSPEMEKAINIVSDKLTEAGYKPFREYFPNPVWHRGEDEVVLTRPFRKKLRAYALGWVTQAEVGDAEAIYVSSGYSDDYDGIDAKGKIAVISQERPAGKEELLRMEAIKIAADHGAVACLFINERPKGKVLLGAGNFKGVATPVPAFTLTFEEGNKLKRLLTSGELVKLDISSKSFIQTEQVPNLIARIEGERKEKIVIGGHLDSWDLGDGAVDNGQGSAVIFETALLLKKLGIKPLRTIEFVWFNGEEIGLWGSKKYVEAHKNDSIFAMVNLDMPSKITGFNVMGFDSVLPLVKEILAKSGSFGINNTANVAWTNSDHMPFMLVGIPVISPMGSFPTEMVEHYHDFGDTFDKVDKDYISQAAVAVAFLVEGLSNAAFPYFRMSDTGVKELLKKHNIEQRLKKQEEYPF